jgi:hypothetical protein
VVGVPVSPLIPFPTPFTASSQICDPYPPPPPGFLLGPSTPRRSCRRLVLGGSVPEACAQLVWESGFGAGVLTPRWFPGLEEVVAGLSLAFSDRIGACFEPMGGFLG